MSSSVSIVEARRPLAPRLAIALIAALALVFGPLAALPASAVPGVSVDGRVVLSPTADVINSEVTLEILEGADDNTYWSNADTAYADENGLYAFQDVAAGTYRIKSGGPAIDSTYAYGIGESASFAVNGEDVSRPDLTLTPGGTISGTTSDEDTEDPLEDVRVLVHRMEGDRFDQVSERETYSDGNGDYALTGLRSGTYRVEFQADNYRPEYYNNVTDLPDDVNSDNIENITVTAPGTYEVDNAALTPSGTISGLVTDTDEAGIGGIGVTAYQLIDTAGVSRWTDVGSTSTQSAPENPDDLSVAGSYSLSLPIGDYRIGFSDDNNHNFLTEFYDDQPAVDSPDGATLTVTQGNITPADAVLAPAGHITGSLTAEGQDSFVGCVAAYPEDDFDGGPIATAFAGFDDSSAYDLGGLPTGTYKVKFSDCGDDVLATEYYNDQPDFAAAEGVDVTAGETTPDIDAVLAEAPTDGHLVGTVTDVNTEDALAGIEVRVEQKVTPATGDDYWTGVDEQTTGSNGKFDFQLYGGDDYRLVYTAADGLHITEYSGDTTVEDDAEEVRVNAGDVVTRNAELAPAAAITGTLALPIADPTCLTAYSVADANLTTPYYGDIDPGNGSYLVGGLPATGNYKLRFDCGVEAGGQSLAAAAAQNWYLNQTSFAAATPVRAVLGTTTSGLQPVVTTPPVVTPPVVTPPVVTPPAVVKVSPSVKVSVKAGKKKATLTITVRASNGTPTGTISVKVGKKTYRVTLKNGKGKITLKKLKKGKQSFKVVYSGDSKVLGKTVKSKKVKIT